MEPRIQYVKTSDSVSIAYWTIGDGPALVHTPGPWGIGYTLLQIPEVREWNERLSAGRLLVRYDARGTGHSDRDVTDFSLEAHLRDLDAVVERLALGQFALLGFYITGPAAIAYATRHPDRLTHLILWGTFASGRQYRNTTRSRAFDSLRSMARDEWDFYVRTASSTPFPGADPAIVERRRQLMAESVRPNELMRMFDATESLDATAEAAAVQTPTLILHRRESQVIPMELARDLASRIPGAELVVLEGPEPIAGGDDQMLRAINEFLGMADGPARFPSPGDVHTILFTDLASSTALTQRLGDAKAQELVRAHNAIVREALKANGGSEIKHTGDGIMASFQTASGALECAVAIQRAVAARAEDQLAVHIGLNAGEPVAEERDLFGTSVQLARRICDAAEGGEILASNVVRELAAGKGFLFSDIGEVVPKGFEEPVRLYEVRWRE